MVAIWQSLNVSDLIEDLTNVNRVKITFTRQNFIFVRYVQIRKVRKYEHTFSRMLVSNEPGTCYKNFRAIYRDVVNENSFWK